MPNPQEYRDRAHECLELAQAVGRDRLLLLKIADGWLKLADQVAGDSKPLEKTAFSS
jgi:hypothetical protein